MKRIVVCAAVLALLMLAGCGGGESELAGLWFDVDLTDYQLEIFADGTGAERWGISPESVFTWSVEGDEFCVVYEDGSGVCRGFVLDGDRMSMAYMGDESGAMARLERWTG